MCARNRCPSQAGYPADLLEIGLLRAVVIR